MQLAMRMVVGVVQRSHIHVLDLRVGVFQVDHYRGQRRYEHQDVHQASAGIGKKYVCKNGT